MAKGDKPVYTARAKQSPESDYMQTIGAAWSFKEGQGLVVKLTAQPFGWDGSFILVPPYENKEE